jgi:hypothetical protein
MPPSAPETALAPERRGPVVGRFCHGCRSVYPLHAARHVGKPAHGRDHVASPCAFEGRPFTAGAEFWEPAVEVLPPAPAPAVPAAAGA